MLQFQWLLHQQHFLGEEHMNLRLKENQINSKNTHLKKFLCSPVIGNIRLSLHTYINSLSSSDLWYSFLVDGIFSGLVVC